MTEPAIDFVDINGEPCRVWRKGAGPAIGFLAGQGGLPKWIPFLDALAQSFEVVAPSLPGYPGATGHRALDQHVDWVLATRDLLDGCGLGDGARLIGSGPGGALAVEMAALWPASVARLALIAPWGLFDEAEPMRDPWSATPDDLAALMCVDPGRWMALRETPEGANSVEWPIEQTRALEASARLFWPLGNIRLDRRLGRIRCPTLLIWGEADRVLPRSYAEKFRTGISGDAQVTLIPDAGHLAELDRPDETAAVVASFMT